MLWTNFFYNNSICFRVFYTFLNYLSKKYPLFLFPTPFHVLFFFLIRHIYLLHSYENPRKLLNSQARSPWNLRSEYSKTHTTKTHRNDHNFKTLTSVYFLSFISAWESGCWYRWILSKLNYIFSFSLQFQISQSKNILS